VARELVLKGNWELDQKLFQAHLQARRASGKPGPRIILPKGSKLPYASDVRNRNGHFTGGEFPSMQEAFEFITLTNIPSNYITVVRNKYRGRKFLIWVENSPAPKPSKRKPKPKPRRKR
jgi:hypothetical protein